MAQPGVNFAKNDGQCFMCVTEFTPYDYRNSFTQLADDQIQSFFATDKTPYFCTLDYKCRDNKLANYNCESGIKACLLFETFTDHYPDLIVDDAQSVTDQFKKSIKIPLNPTKVATISLVNAHLAHDAYYNVFVRRLEPDPTLISITDKEVLVAEYKPSSKELDLLPIWHGLEMAVDGNYAAIGRSYLAP